MPSFNINEMVFGFSDIEDLDTFLNFDAEDDQILSSAFIDDVDSL